MRRYLTLILAGLFSVVSSQAFADDSILCTAQDQMLVCNLSVENLMTRASKVMTNGWENQIEILYELIDSNENVVKTSKLSAAQRCYIDPFESPCLVLWRGAKAWREYRDERMFLTAMSTITAQAMKLKDLAPDNYRVRATLTVQSGSTRQMQDVKQWFRQSGTDTSRSSDSSLIGSFISSYTPEALIFSKYIEILETTNFFIDPSF